MSPSPTSISLFLHEKAIGMSDIFCELMISTKILPISLVRMTERFLLSEFLKNGTRYAILYILTN